MAFPSFFLVPGAGKRKHSENEVGKMVVDVLCFVVLLPHLNHTTVFWVNVSLQIDSFYAHANEAFFQR